VGFKKIMVDVNYTVVVFSGKDALILFFGVYLTAVINLIRKYRTFDIYLFFSKDKAKKNRSMRRFLSGFMIIDVIPILWFLILYTFVIPNTVGPFPIMAAAFAALSVLGFTRILHSVVATERHKNFYSDEEFATVMSKWGKGHDADNSFKAHFITGFSYLIIFPVIAYFIILI
jgi:hypothetical protein